MNILQKLKTNSTNITLDLKKSYKGLNSVFGTILCVNETENSLLFYVHDHHIVEHFLFQDIEQIVTGNQVIIFYFIK